jgi:hypothetical protein
MVAVAVNCSDAPFARLVRAGVITMLLTVAVPPAPPLTVNVVDPLMLPIAAEMAVTPADTPVANPPALMAANLVAEEAQTALKVTLLVVPSLKVAIAVNCSVPFGASEALSGVTAMDLTVAVGEAALPMVSIVAPVTPLFLAARLLAPSPTPVAKPVALMVTNSGCDVVQSDVVVTSFVVPSLMVAVAANCKLVPCAIVVRAGVTTMDLMVGVPVPEAAVTVNAVTALTLPMAAEMLEAPAATPFATPAALMVAVPIADEVHVAVLVTLLVVPSLNVATAVYWSVALAASDALAGDTAIEVTVAVGAVAFPTVKMVAPVTAPILAAMLLAPNPTPCANPVAVMVANSGCEVFHCEEAVTSWVVPSLRVAVALNCSVLPSAMVVRAGVTVMTVMVGAATAMMDVVNAKAQSTSCNRKCFACTVEIIDGHP